MAPSGSRPTAAIVVTIICLTISGVLITRAAITSALHNAELLINDALTEIDQPTATDALALKWSQIAEDFADDEFELLRRADRMMAGVEAKVLREWQDMPYDHEIWGL